MRLTGGRRSGRRFAATTAVAALLVLSVAQGEGAVLTPTWAAAVTTPDAPAAPVTCHDGAMQIVAHEDDDLLFLSPDLLHDVQSGRCVRTVVVTAGDAARGTAYWQARESGSRAAYARMAGVPDVWTTTDAGVAGHPIPLLTLAGDPRVSLAFMRLPDGNRRGTGMQV